jgi:hypothetical protein
MARSSTDPAEVLGLDLGADEPAVCPEHLRFVPCRRCAPGEAKFSADPADVERARAYQSGADVPNPPVDDRR